MSFSTKVSGQPLSFAQILIFNLPAAGMIFLIMPTFAVLQGIYAKSFGLQLALIGTIYLVARLFDVVTDPLIGYWSDQSRAKGCSRKFWIAGGSLAFTFCAYFLYVPPDDVSAGYFLFWFLALYLAWTFYQVPHSAWAATLARDSRARIRIFGTRSFFISVGVLGFYALPMLPMFETTEFTPETLKVAVILGGIYLCLTIIVLLRYAPEGDYVPASRQQGGLRTYIKSFLSNRPFLIFGSAYLLIGMGSGIWVSLKFLVLDSYFGVGEKIAQTFLIGTVAGMVALPVWLRLANFLGKRQTWAISQGLVILLVSLPYFLPPGEQSYYPLLLIMIGIYIAGTCPGAVASAMVADIIDYDTLKSGAERAGVYFSNATLILKMGVGVGSGLGLMLSGWLGFDPVATGDSQNAQFAVQIAFCAVPAVIYLVAFLITLKMPLNNRRMAIIRRRLEQRIERLKRQSCTDTDRDNTYKEALVTI